MVRSWMKLIWISFGVAVVAVAAQLGIAEALGIIQWGASFQDEGANAWKALLTWLAFIYAVGVLSGAAVGRRAIRRPTRSEGLGARSTAVLFAAIGAAVAGGLAWLPSREAQAPVNVDPDLAVAMTAGAAIVAAAVVALVALSSAPVAGSVRAAVAWVWFVATGCAIAGLLTHVPFAAPRLGVVDAPSIFSPRSWSGPNLMIGVAGVLGLVVAIVARWGGAHRFGIAMSGLAGPAVIASAYLIAGPGSANGQLEPYYASLIAAGAGLCVSVIVAIPGRRSPERATVDPWAPVRQYDPDEPLLGEIMHPPPGAHARRGDADRPPPITFDEDYSDWLRDLGQAPGGQQAATGQQQR